MSAKARAAVSWTKKPIEEALARLGDEPLTDALVGEAVAALEGPFAVITRAMIDLSAHDLDSLRVVARQDLERDRSRLAAAIRDEDSRDTLGWVFAVLESFFDIAFDAYESLGPAEMQDEALRAGMKHPELRPLVRGAVSLMAAIELSKRGELSELEVERVEDLLDVSFLQLMKLQRRFGAELGLPAMVPTDSAERVVHYAERLRASLTPRDWDFLEDARMGDLR